MGKLIETGHWGLAYQVDQIEKMLENLPEDLKSQEPFKTMLTERVFGTMKKWGVECMYIRNPLGIYCGYARIKESHPLSKVVPSDIEGLFKVHGGITYCQKIESDIVIGFDCAHWMDLVPYLDLASRNGELYEDLKRLKATGDIYRNEEYVREQLIELCRQIKEKEYEDTFR